MHAKATGAIPKKLSDYIPFVHFLGKALGPNYEVFLYDLSKKDHKIIAIENGFISGRKKGSLMKDVIIKVLETEGPKNPGEFIQRDAVSRDGRRFKSSSRIIRDEDGSPIGVFCINFNIDPFLHISDFLESFQVNFHSTGSIDLSKILFEGEAFGDGEESDLDILYKKGLMKNRTAEMDTAAGRQEMIDILYKEGFFNLRGAVNYAAQKINISEPSVYRYLQNSKERDKK